MTEIQARKKTYGQLQEASAATGKAMSAILAEAVEEWMVMWQQDTPKKRILRAYGQIDKYVYPKELRERLYSCITAYIQEHSNDEIIAAIAKGDLL